MSAKKRFLSLLLCGAMLFSLCPQAAFAEGAEAEDCALYQEPAIEPEESGESQGGGAVAPTQEPDDPTPPAGGEPEKATAPAESQDTAPLPPANNEIDLLADASNVEYIDAQGVQQTCDNATVVESTATTWGADDGQEHWYVVSSDVTISERITVTGDVHLILADGCTLTTSKGITVASGNSLTIYAQSEDGGMGKLDATGTNIGDNDGTAGIGGTDESTNFGKITINGGTITAIGGNRAAGIGGGGQQNNSDTLSGIITINGGNITASGGYCAAGIGAGPDGRGGTVSVAINGGTVATTGGYGGVGIGNGFYGRTNVTVTISGGTVTANNGGSGAGIGDGFGSYDSTSFTTGDNGNAVIIASSISDQNNTSGWKGVIFQGSTGQVYGNVTPTEDFEVPEGSTLTVPSGSSLTIDDVTVTNNSTIVNYGTITGDVSGSGKVLEGTTIEISLSNDGGSVAYGSQVSITATVTKPSDDSAVNGGTVMFYRSDKATGIALNGDGTSVYNGTAIYTIDTLDWTPGDYTITAVYTPTEDSNLSESSGTATLTVTKAAPPTAPRAPAASATTPPTANSITLNEITGSGQGDVQYGYTIDGSASDISNWQDGTTFSDLTAATAYTFYARYAGNDYYEPSPASSGTMIYTAHAAPVAGEGYTIDYAAETVTANSSYEVRLTDSDTWGTSPLNITPGGSFQVRHAADTDGAPASEGTTVTVAKRPAAPALSIDNEAEGVVLSNEYYYNTTGADDSNTWTQGAGEVVHVDPSATIDIYQAATDSTFKSAVLTLTAPARANTPTVPAIDYEKETLSGTDTGMEWGIALEQNAPTQWTACTANMTLKDLGWNGEALTVQFRTAATDSNYASEAVSLNIPARPAAPAVQGINESVQGKNDGKITGLTAGTDYQISDDNGLNWQDAALTGTEITGLAPGTYQVRVKGTSTSFAGIAAEVAIATGTSSDSTAVTQGNAPTPTPAPDGTVYYTCPACGTHDWTATAEGYRCDACGHLVTAQLSGYGNVKGLYDPAAAPGAQNGAGYSGPIPQIGDESRPLLWALLLVLSGSALGGLTLCKKKRK